MHRAESPCAAALLLKQEVRQRGSYHLRTLQIYFGSNLEVGNWTGQTTCVYKDEGCYLCLFITYPAGALTDTQAGCAVQVLSCQKQNFVPIPDVKLTTTTGLDEGSGSASRRFIGMLIVAGTCLCALVFTVLLIRRQRSRLTPQRELSV
ncbi:uncharacterized protein [Paralichthys olivaceus]|uniref:uncharacterized protein isoform X3 n=1 Tax=Paralichthys olivaceus TaxID=8255 RepID=UPI003750C3DC